MAIRWPMHRPSWLPLPVLGIVCAVAGFSLSADEMDGTTSRSARPTVPRSPDARLVVELFAREPEIMTPTGLAVDRRGRVFVAESHTHFRPEGYDGPPADRILIFEDTDGDGRADRRTVFHEGFTHVMDIEFDQRDRLYVATRMDIHRLDDTNSDGRADAVVPIVKMETEGNYPHNGLSGLAFDFRGDLIFGLGENLGKSYVLVGADGVRIPGGGEGGSTYHSRSDGTGLKRISTGWWNPFGMCSDAFGRVFGTDNDPDASPPCRLIQVVPGGDYGYEFRYGRTGLHPLTTWNGTLPGTLPMISGTGEAPCAIVAYDSDGLPVEYRGQLLVPSWADHRLERYPLRTTSESGFAVTQREVLIEGPDDFRPVGVDVAPDGSVFVSDWVSSSYTLHKLGRIWRLRWKDAPSQVRPVEPAAAAASLDRRTRETAVHTLTRSAAGLAVLRELSRSHADAAVRATAVMGLANSRADADYEQIVQADPDLAVRVVAVRAAAELGRDLARLWEKAPPAPVRAELLGKLDPRRKDDLARLRSAARANDPLLRHAAIEALAGAADLGPDFYRTFAKSDPLAALLSWKRNAKARSGIAQQDFEQFLGGGDPDLRLAAIKWIADEERADCRGLLERLLSDASLDVPNFLAVSAALVRLDGKPPADRPSLDTLLARLRDPGTPAELQRVILRLSDPAQPKVRIDDLARLTEARDEVALEAIRTLAGHPSPERLVPLRKIAVDVERPARQRAAAVGGLATTAASEVELLLKLAVEPLEADNGRQPDGDARLVRDEARRALVGVPLNAEHRARLQGAGPAAESIQRLVSGSVGDRPDRQDTRAWQEFARLEGNRAAGELIFFGPKVGTCSRCHQFEGRGSFVGPDLSRIRERFENAGADRTWLLETILVPGKQMAPQYTPWIIQLKDGRTMTGLPRRKGGNSEAYLGADGREFSLKKDEIEFHQESTVSLMPQDLLNQLTRQELADLLAFLEGR